MFRKTSGGAAARSVRVGGGGFGFQSRIGTLSPAFSPTAPRGRFLKKSGNPTFMTGSGDRAADKHDQLVSQTAEMQKIITTLKTMRAHFENDDFARAGGLLSRKAKGEGDNIILCSLPDCKNPSLAMYHVDPYKYDVCGKDCIDKLLAAEEHKHQAAVYELYQVRKVVEEKHQAVIAEARMTAPPAFTPSPHEFQPMSFGGQQQQQEQQQQQQQQPYFDGGGGTATPSTRIYSQSQSPMQPVKRRVAFHTATVERPTSFQVMGSYADAHNESSTLESLERIGTGKTSHSLEKEAMMRSLQSSSAPTAGKFYLRKHAALAAAGEAFEATHTAGEVLVKRGFLKNMTAYCSFVCSVAAELANSGNADVVFAGNDGQDVDSEKDMYIQLSAAEARCLAAAQQFRAHLCAITELHSTGCTWANLKIYLVEYWDAYGIALWSDDVFIFASALYPKHFRKAEKAEHLGGGVMQASYHALMRSTPYIAPSSGGAAATQRPAAKQEESAMNVKFDKLLDAIQSIQSKADKTAATMADFSRQFTAINKKLANRSGGAQQRGGGSGGGQQ